MSGQTPEQVLQRIDWHVIRRLDGLLQGDYRSLFHGFGLDLADLREYQPGDDIRYIDWNVTARLDTPYVRKYMEDREIMAHFILDVTPSIDFGTQGALKRDQLRSFVAAMARLLTRHGNRVGAILFDGRATRVIPARGGRLQVLRLLHDLDARAKSQATGSATDLCSVLQAATMALRRRSLVFIVSDFFSEPGWERPLRMLGRRHEVLAVRLWDPREVELPDVGPLIMQDAETGEQIYVDTRDRGFQRRFKEAVERRETALQTAFRQSHVDVLSLATTDDLVKAIYRFAGQRKQMARGKARAT